MIKRMISFFALFVIIFGTTNAYAGYSIITSIQDVGGQGDPGCIGCYTGWSPCIFCVGELYVCTDNYDCNGNKTGSQCLYWSPNTLPAGSIVGSVINNNCGFTIDNTNGQLGSPPYCRNGVAQPIDVTSGNMYHAFQEFSFDYSTARLEFIRSYNSQSTYNGPMGYGWSHNYDLQIDSSTNKVGIRRADGKYIYFIKQADGTTYNPWYWTKTTFVRSDPYYVWTTEDGTVYKFNTSNGKLRYIVNSTGGTLTLDYDGSNRLIKVSEPFGHFIALAYDGNGKIHTVTDPAGKVYTYTYLNGDLDSITYQDGASEHYIYDNHNLTSVRDPNGNYSMQWSYDANDKCTMSSGEGVNNHVDLQYNTGQTIVTKYIDGVPKTTTYNYTTTEHIGTVTSILGYGCSECSSGGIYTYDTDPYKQTTVTDKKGNLSTYSNYDTKGNPGKIVQAFGSASTRTTSYTYHPVTSAPTSIKRKSAILFGSYSTASRVFSYDSSNRLIKAYSRGNFKNISGIARFYNYSTSYSYTSHGQVKETVDPLGRRAAFDYYSTIPGDPNHGQLKSVSRSLDGVPYTSSFGNYSSGKPSWMVDATGAQHIYTYDLRGRLLAVSAHTRTTRFGYDAFGNMTSAVLPTGKKVGYEYDGADRVTKIRDGLGNYVTYGYDTEGNRTSEDAHDASGSLLKQLKYVYNSLNRLDKVTDSSGAATYSQIGYDNNDNVVNVNQLTSTGYAYDADGNMTSFKTPEGYAATATYDAENRLKTVLFTDSNNVQHNYSFIYSGDGMLAKQVIDGVETRFVRDGFLCLQERNASNNVTRAYAWDGVSPGGIGGLLELTVGSEHYNYLYDGKGNVSALINSAQVPVVKYRNDAFGNIVGKSSVEGLPDLVKDQPYQFSTKYYYPGFGGNDAGYRFYLASLGCWMMRDPMGEAGGENLYQFVSNNPINLYDVLGLEPSPKYREKCASLRNKLKNLEEMLKQKEHEYLIDKNTLPETVPGSTKRYDSRQGHRETIEDIKKNIEKTKADIQKYCGDDDNSKSCEKVPLVVPPPLSDQDKKALMKGMATATLMGIPTYYLLLMFAF